MRQHPNRSGSRPMLARASLPALALGALLAPGITHAHNLNLNQIAGLRERDLVHGLGAAGLTPEALAAAGVDHESATAVVAAAASYLGHSPNALGSAVTHLGAASAEVDRLERLVRRGAAIESAAVTAAREDRDDAQGTLDALLAGLRASAMSPLAAGERAALNAIRPNLDRDVPVEYMLAERSEADWTNLRDALANESQAQSGVTEVDHDCSSLLESARDEGVADAQANLAAHLETVKAAYLSAVETLGE